MTHTPLLFDGFEKAFVGYAQQAGRTELAVYDYDKMLKILRDRDGMSGPEALEFLEFNTVCAWAGEGTPLILTRTTLKRCNERLEDEMTAIKPKKNHPWAMKAVKKPANPPKTGKTGKKDGAK